MKQIAPNSMIQNRYLIVQMIGKGGMGEVYLAVDQRLGSAVALKRTFFHENAELGNAFEREAKILGRLRHPVLPKVIDHFIEGGEQYLVMEHISGDDLGKRLENAGKPFPLSWVMFWADQMLDALNHLHSHEPPIVHRDIKPENLKLTDDNHIVLLDFGLSKDFDSEAKKASLGTGSIVGYSPYYASMEQVRGTGTDARSDIYSLSATLYQLLTNEFPVDSLTRADAMLGGSPDPIAAISDSNPEVSPEISDVILKGIAIRKEDRFDTAAEMQKALRRAFNQGADAGKDPAPLASEAPTAIRSVPPEISGITSKPTEDVSPLAADTIQFTTGATDPVVRQADIATQIFKDGSLTDDAVEEDFDGEVTRRQMPTAETPVAETPVVGSAEVETPETETPEVDASEEEVVSIAAAAAAGVAEPAAFAAVPQTAAIPPKKKSKAGVVVGLLVGLLLLGGVAGGGGWYAYNNYYLPSKANASPTPTPETTVSPSPQPTADVADSNQNTNSNSTVGQTDNSNASDNSNRTVVTTPTDPRQPPTTVGKNPPNQTPKPPTTKTPPKTKAKDDRTVILQ